MKKQFNLLLIFFILILFFYTRKFTERFSNEINVPVFVINLEKDKDRMDLFRKNIYPIFKNNVSRIEGVKHKIGMIGCRLAHTKANISAINKGHPYYIICEDDILPLLDKGEINQFIKNIIKEDPDLVLFEQGINLEKRIKMRKTNNKNLYRLFGNGNNAGAYLCKREFGIKLIDHWTKNPNKHIDISWRDLWPSHKVYFHRPQLFIQNEGYSNQSNINWRDKTTPFDWKLWEEKNKF